MYLTSPGDEEQDPGYSPQRALSLALTDWLQEFLSTDQPGGRAPNVEPPAVLTLTPPPQQRVVALLIPAGPCRPPASLQKERSDDTGGSSYVPGLEENPLYTAEPLTLDDLRLLTDLFHLPYEHGPTAGTMLQELDWLKRHSWAAAAETDTVLCF